MTMAALPGLRDPVGSRSPEPWPLTARSEELEVIAGVLHRNGGQGGVVLAGAAGVGRTRLAREALARARGRTAQVRWVAATASARILPLGAFSSLVADQVGVGEPSSTTLRRITDAVVAEGAGRPLLIGVDDAHLLDEFSAAVLHQLALRRAASLVVTVRSGAPAPDAVTALWKDGHLARLEIQPLSAEETASLVESVLGGPMDGHSARRLYAATQGNALFLRHLTEGALHYSGLSRIAGVWQWRGDAAVTPQLTELVDAQIGTLSPALHDVVELLAFGEPLDADVLALLADPAAVERADRRGLITVEAREDRLEVRLAHPIYGDVLRAKTSALRARRWRGRIARALAVTGPCGPKDLLRQAVLALDSDSPPDPELLNAAARSPIAMLDPRLAERLARAARDGGGGFEPRLSLCYALTWQGRFGAAEAELAELDLRAATDDERTRAAIARAGNLFWGMSDQDAARAVLDRMKDCLLDQACRDELSAFSSAIAFAQGDGERARDLAARVLRARNLRDGAVFWAAMGGTGALGLAGRCAEIGDLPARGLVQCAGSFERSWLRFGLGAQEIAALRLAGRLTEAEQRAHAFAEDAQGSGAISESVCSVLVGSVALDRGLVRTAVRRLRDAAAAFAVHGPGGNWRVQCGLALTQALALTGDAAGAREAFTLTEARGHPAVEYLRPQVRLADAWLAVAEGAVSTAIRIARQAAQEAAELGQYAVEVLALHSAVCLGDRTLAERLGELASAVDGPRAAAAAAHAVALAAGDGAALDVASARFENMGALLCAADAAAQAACAHHRSGARSAAIAASARAGRLAAACEGATTPAVQAVHQPLPLTRREREIAGMVTAGLSNRDIADRLVVSIRTVEGHVLHACAKLCVSDRTGLAALITGRV